MVARRAARRHAERYLSNHFTAVPAAARLVPAAYRKPKTPGVQTAMVVGHAGDTVTTERDLRVPERRNKSNSVCRRIRIQRPFMQVVFRRTNRRGRRIRR